MTINDTDDIQNRNVFKHDPGFGGLVLEGDGDPKPGAKVEIYGPNSTTKLIATVYTDQDGFYSYSYKHTGKSATYTIKLPDYNLSTTATVKANGVFWYVFTVP